MAGNSDKAQESVDSLEIDAYYKGLVGYIENCKTPMTISIQGEWGSGKTSIMNFIKNDLAKSSKNYRIIEFNTWQYSQFDLGDRLPFSLIEEIVNAIASRESVSGKNVTRISKMLSVIAPSALTLLSFSGFGNLAETIKIDKILELFGGANPDSQGTIEDFDPVKSLKDLKNSFKEVVDEACPGVNDKLVVFIDDLDRLEPVRAIELLECLKLFIECDKCVFILAIDFEVVLQGVTQKYGWDGSDKANLVKAKAYFEKFIQLPFYVPINFYKTNKFIRERLEEIVEEGADGGLMRHYVEATSNSVGNNPRSINRLINTYTLAIQTIKHKDSDFKLTHKEYLALYVLLCIQISFNEDYNEIVHQLVYSSEERFRSFLGNFETNDDINRAQLEMLVASLSGLLQSDEDETESGDGVSYSNLVRLVDFTAIVNTHETTVVGSVSALSARFNNIFDSNERYEKLRSETSEYNRELLAYFEKKLKENLQDDSLQIASQKYQYWTIYVNKRKFAEITYSQNGRIGVNFGRGTKKDRVKNQYFTSEWEGLVEYLRYKSGIEEIDRKILKDDPMSFKVRDNTNPIRITGIDNKQNVDKVVDILKRAYEIFIKTN